MKLLLVFPPQWASIVPYLSVPSLTAYLRKQGVDVIQRDINAEFNDLMLDPAFLATMSRRIEQHIGTRCSQTDLDYLRATLAVSGAIRGEVGEAKAVLKSPERFQNSAALLKSQDAISEAFRLASAAFYPTQIDFLRMQKMRYRLESLSEVIEAVEDETENIFRSVTRDYFLDGILAVHPDAIGLSILAETQVIPALTLASLVKARMGIPIILGGSLFSHLDRELFERSDMWRFCDAIILREGEVPMLQLLRALRGEAEYKDIPNLVYRDNGRTLFTPEQPPLKTEELPPPTFDGFPLRKYLTPGITLPILSARGCPWGRCSFCSTRNILHSRFMPRRPEQVAEDILLLRDTYGAHFFWFADECLPPVRLRQISQALVDRQAGIQWASYMRPEKDLTPEICRLAAVSGARVFRFGVESASNRLLKLMGKGNNLEIVTNSLRSSKEAGIWTHACLIVAFPGETAEEARSTIRFVLQRRDIIDSVSISAFRLKKGSDIARRSEEFGIEAGGLGSRGGFTVSWGYDAGEASLRREGFDYRREWDEALSDAYPDFGVWGRLSHELLFMFQALKHEARGNLRSSFTDV